MSASTSTSANVTFVAESTHTKQAVAAAAAAAAAAPAVALARAVEPVAVPPSMSVDSLAALAKQRTLVLCFDGTSNQYDGKNTCITTFHSLLKKDDTDQQLCYYQQGTTMLDEAIAWYLDAHFRGGYTSLMQKYRPGTGSVYLASPAGVPRGVHGAGAVARLPCCPRTTPSGS
ncbi:DUF2235 domain-containing protein [Phanerochaete sordida]|uniref:DUF2235 domain-containing protein n=1 Tax=Phanerochaete sordida TaxID=48140 RepID=A0A9P3GQQ2_9APHY|nr:DUF2235 domain-containing protein [Phanerochaete sordida]